MVNDFIYDLGLLPVIKIEDVDKAKPLAKALIDGDMPAAEITFRTVAAKEAIKAITYEFPDMLVGAGTILTTSQVDDAMAAGAKFIISPGLNPKMVQYCIDKKIPVYPGVNSPSQIEQAIELGLNTVKFFPAENSGGLDMLKAMSAPYGNMKFMPTGGINANNIVKYLSFNQVVACGGSWIVPENAIKTYNFAEITRITSEAVSIVVGLKLSCFGNDRVESSLLSSAFGVNYDNDGGKYIGFTVNNMRRALAFLKRKGIDAANVEKNSAGKPIAAELNINIDSYAVHIRTVK